MNNAVITQLLKHELSGPPFNRAMSKDARKLRDDVYELAFIHGLPNGDTEKRQWIKKLIDSYDPLNFERAILYDHYDRIIEAVNRRTSVKFKKDSDSIRKGEMDFKDDHKRGTKSKSSYRLPGLDWLNIAQFSDWEDIWYRCVNLHKANISIEPKHFNTTISQFRDMYNLFVGELYYDFNRNSLIHIYQMASKYSLDFVKECMGRVVDVRQKEPNYIIEVVKKEHAILQAELEESNQVEKETVELVKSVVSYVNYHDEIDWGKVKKDLKKRMDNKEEFDKVKLS